MAIITMNNLPTHCEYCGSKLIWDSVNLICGNPFCPHNTYEQIKAWCLNIAPVDNLGWKTIEKLLPDSINNIYDFYVDNWEELGYAPEENKIGSEKFLFNKMLIRLHQPISISQFLLALNIQGLGKKGAEAIEKLGLDFFRCFIKSLEDGPNGSIAIEGKIAKVIQDKNVACNFYCDNRIRDKILQCYKLVNFKQDIKENVTIEEKGTVVITGSLNNGMSRDNFINLLATKGWKVVNNVTKNVKYLITDNPNSNTTKNKKADELGIEKITGEEFINEKL